MIPSAFGSSPVAWVLQLFGFLALVAVVMVAGLPVAILWRAVEALKGQLV